MIGRKMDLFGGRVVVLFPLFDVLFCDVYYDVGSRLGRYIPICWENPVLFLHLAAFGGILWDDTLEFTRRKCW